MAATLVGASVGIVFGFSIAATGLVALGAGVVFGFRHHSLLIAWSRTAYIAAVFAQLTSIFVTPFTWPLRFGFFFILLGSFAAWLSSQLKHL